jgi:hypothetical protein
MSGKRAKFLKELAKEMTSKEPEKVKATYKALKKKEIGPFAKGKGLSKKTVKSLKYLGKKEKEVKPIAEIKVSTKEAFKLKRSRKKAQQRIKRSMKRAIFSNKAA